MDVCQQKQHRSGQPCHARGITVITVLSFAFSLLPQMGVDRGRVHSLILPEWVSCRLQCLIRIVIGISGATRVIWPDVALHKQANYFRVGLYAAGLILVCLCVCECPLVT